MSNARKVLCCVAGAVVAVMAVVGGINAGRRSVDGQVRELEIKQRQELDRVASEARMAEAERERRRREDDAAFQQKMKAIDDEYEARMRRIELAEQPDRGQAAPAYVPSPQPPGGYGKYSPAVPSTFKPSDPRPTIPVGQAATKSVLPPPVQPAEFPKWDPVRVNGKIVDYMPGNDAARRWQSSKPLIWK